jgi:pimeloyl-ACP methyl ester carboxylesterase
VRFDHRGSGLSIELCPTSPWTAWNSTWRHHQGLDTGGQNLGEFDSGPIAISYAAHNPDRVNALALWCSWARDADIGDHSTWDALDDDLD